MLQSIKQTDIIGVGAASTKMTPTVQAANNQRGQAERMCQVLGLLSIVGISAKLQ